MVVAERFGSVSHRFVKSKPMPHTNPIGLGAGHDNKMSPTSRVPSLIVLSIAAVLLNAFASDTVPGVYSNGVPLDFGVLPDGDVEEPASEHPPGLAAGAVLEKLAAIQMLDVWFPTMDGHWLVMPG